MMVGFCLKVAFGPTFCPYKAKCFGFGLGCGVPSLNLLGSTSTNHGCAPNAKASAVYSDDRMKNTVIDLLVPLRTESLIAATGSLR
jgi:hypothetical protein